MWPAVAAGSEIPTDVPRIEDVLRTPLRPPPGSPQPHSHARDRAATGPVDGEIADGAEAVLDAAVERPPVRRRRRARTVSGVWARPYMLAATATVALLVGVASGLGYDFLRGTATDEEAPPPATPQACAVAQVAWARSANAQVKMSADDPGTLVTGFAEAREALVGVQPPAAVAADWSTVVGFMDEVSKAVDDAKDESEVEAAVVEVLERQDASAMTAAAKRITAYLKAGCEA